MKSGATSDRVSSGSAKKISDRVYDTFYFWLDIIEQRSLEFLDERYTTFVRHCAPKLIGAFTFIFSLLAIFKRNEESKVVRVILAPWKLLLGVILAAILLAFLLALVAIAGAFSGIFGLRNLSEYRLREQIAAWSLVLVFFLSCPFFLNQYYLSKIEFTLAFGLILIGVCFLYGQCGIVTLGQSGFVFLGSYCTAWFHLGTFFPAMPLMLSIFLGAICSGLFGVLLGLPSLRVKDYHLLVITMVFSIMVPKVVRSKWLSSYAGVSSGGLMIEKPAVPGFFSSLSQDTWTYYLVTISAFVLIYFAYNLIHHSQISRAFRVIKCDVEVSTILGVPVFRYKLLAFALSAFYAGFAGGLFLLLIGFIGPDSFAFQDSIDYMVASIIGGPEGILGAVIGGAFLSYETNLMRLLSELIPNGENLMRAVTGLVVIFMVYVFPYGIAGHLMRMMKIRFTGSTQRGSYRIAPPADYDFLNQRQTRSESRMREMDFG